MGDNYAEVIIKKRTDALATFFRIFTIIVTVAVVYATILYFQAVGPVVIALFIYLDYIVFKNTDVEFEYFFINGQLDVECIYGKKKRKPAKSFNFDKLEVMAPKSNQKILAYEHRTDIKDFNYTSCYEDRDVYVAILVGKDGKLGRLYFEPSEAMVKAISTHCPNKVYK